MKLYYSPGACSLSPHIALHASGLSHETEKVDLRSHTTAGGKDYYTIAPKGAVPALELDNGELLTEGPAIVQYIADLVPERNLAPRAGTLARVRLQEWLNFIGTEIHKSFGPIFQKAPEEQQQAARAKLDKALKHLEPALGKTPFLLGDTFSVADGYLFTMTQWMKGMHVALDAYPNVRAFQQRVAALPAVQAALKHESAPA